MKRSPQSHMEQLQIHHFAKVRSLNLFGLSADTPFCQSNAMHGSRMAYLQIHPFAKVTPCMDPVWPIC